jgi:hypothetical protein
MFSELDRARREIIIGYHHGFIAIVFMHACYYLLDGLQAYGLGVSLGLDGKSFCPLVRDDIDSKIPALLGCMSLVSKITE